MDLKALLEANKSKIGNTQSIRKPVEIATQDRPYSAEPIPVDQVKPATKLTTKTHKQVTTKQDNTPVTKPIASLPSPIYQEENSEPRSVISDEKMEDLVSHELVAVIAAPQPEDEIKPTTNRQQTGNKPVTNSKQTDNKLATNRQQSNNNSKPENLNRQQSGNATGNTTGNKVITNRQQTDNKPATETPFSELVGLQREIIIFICHECKKVRSRVTERLTLEYIAHALERSAGVIKTTTQRLERKGCLRRDDSKNGRGGWTRYELPDSIYHDVLRTESGNKPTTNWQQTGNKVVTQPATEPATSSSSSSSSLSLKETTTTELSDEWHFDIAPYARFGFTRTQLKQLASLGVISASDVEQSLIEFTYDLDNNSLPPIKTGKINFLMGFLRKGHSYVSETFVSAQEALILEMAKRAEDKRQKLLAAKFEAWEATLTDDERGRILSSLPTSLMVLHRAHGLNNKEVREWLFNYYLKISPSLNAN